MNKEVLGKQIKTELRKVLSSFVVIISSAILGLILLLLVNSLPSNKISANVSEKIATEGYALNPSDTWTLLDGYTDNLMMNIAAFPNQESLIRRTLLVPYADFYGGANMMSHLTDLVNGREVTPEYTTYYGRYWHGYLTFIKPMLLLLNYGQIRMLNLLLMLMLLILVEYKIIKSYGATKGLAFFSVLLCINPISAVLCLQYSTVTYIIMISVLVLLKIKEKMTSVSDLFLLYLITGIAVAFFDLLTFPLVSLGTLLITELLIEKRTSCRSLFLKLYYIVRCSAYWCFGYFGMWGCKHLLVGILTDYDIWLDVKATAFTRIKGGDLDLSLLNIFSQNTRVMLESSGLLIAVATLIVLCAITSLIETKKLGKSGKTLKSYNLLAIDLIPYLFIGIYPFVWYAVLRNHSLTHYWLTFRELAITVYSLITMLEVFLKWRKNPAE